MRPRVGNITTKGQIEFVPFDVHFFSFDYAKVVSLH